MGPLLSRNALQRKDPARLQVIGLVVDMKFMIIRLNIIGLKAFCTGNKASMEHLVVFIVSVFGHEGFRAE